MRFVRVFGQFHTMASPPGSNLQPLPPFPCLTVGDIAADGDGIAGIAVLGDQDATETFRQGVFGAISTAVFRSFSTVPASWAVISRTRSRWCLIIVVSFDGKGWASFQASPDYAVPKDAEEILRGAVPGSL